MTRPHTEFQLRLITCALIAFLAAPPAFAQSSSPATTNAETVALLHALRQHESGTFKPVVWDTNGQLVSVSIGGTNASDSNLFLLSRIHSLQTLRLQTYGTGERVSREGYASLQQLTNLTGLRVACAFAMHRGIFEEICRLNGLRRLTLYYAYPTRDKYTNLVALTNLEEFTNTGCTNFGPQEVKLLTNLTKLKSIMLELSDASKQDTNVLSSLKNLTNLTIYYWPR